MKTEDDTFLALKKWPLKEANNWWDENIDREEFYVPDSLGSQHFSEKIFAKELYNITGWEIEAFRLAYSSWSLTR